MKTFFHRYYHKKYHGIYRHAKKLFVLDLALLAIAIGLTAANIILLFEMPKITDQIELVRSLGSSKPITISLNAPDASFPGRSFSFTYTVTNNSEKKIDRLQMIYIWNKTSSEGKFDNITLNSHETKTLNKEILTPAAGGKYLLQLKPAVQINNHLVALNAIEKTVEILAPKITVAVKPADSLAYAETGQTIPVEISWKNNSDFALKNLRLKISSLPGIVDLPQTAKTNRFKLENNYLLIDSSVRTEFANGNHASSDTFTVYLKLLPSFSLSQTENANLEITPTMEAETDQVAGQIFSQPGETVKIPLATELTLQATARYYTPEDDQLGRGPLPPRVGETTKYWIFADVANTTNAAQNAEFAASLPVGVEFTGRQSITIGPPLTYDQAARRVSWKFSELPANSLTGLYFEVAVTPSSANLGKTILLAKDIAFTATDGAVKKLFLLTKKELTNVLNANDRGSSAGAAVVEKKI